VPGTLILKADPSALTATALLTSPEIDYEGDWVQPDGGVWEPDLYVRTGVPVDRAHGEKIGRGTVEMMKKSFDGKEWIVPIGTTYFTKGNRLSEQTFRLVNDDIMTGVSLEFRPLVAKSMGHRAALSNRDAMRYDRWHAYGWAHDIQPINANARTLLPEVEQKALVRIEKAIKIAESGRYGSEYQHPLIVKSFSALVPKPKYVRVEKAMDETLAPEGMIGDAPDMGGSDTYPTAAAAFDFAQAISDACDAAEAGIGNGEHVKGIGKLRKLIEDVRSYADDSSAIGEMVEADLDGKMDTEGEAADDTTTETEDNEMDAADDDEGPVEKAVFRKGVLITKSGYVPKRFRASDFKPAAIAEPAMELKAAQDEADSALRLAKRNRRKNQPYLDALEVNAR